MLKFLIIASLVLYLVYKVGSLFFKAGAASQQLRNQQKKAFDSANNNNPKPKSNSKPGEYVDYEEVK
jgi:hypothetical protein